MTSDTKSTSPLHWGEGAAHLSTTAWVQSGTKAQALVDAPTHKCMEKTGFLKKENKFQKLRLEGQCDVTT